MYSLRLSPRLMGPRLVRTLRTTPFLRDEETAPFVQDQPQSPSKPSMTQGHGRDKLKDPTQGDTDVQSAARSDSRKNQESAQSSESGDDQPLDAARQGSAGGEVKRSSAQSEDRGPDIMSGPFKDQVGGQDERHKGPGVKQGSSETAAGMGLGETIKGAFSGNKTATKKNFSTSARHLAEPPRTDADGSRKPANPEGSLQGEQNEHLKHKDASEDDKGKGNAAPEPSLPSHNKKPTGPCGKASFSTSAWARATKPPGGYSKAIAPEPAHAGYDAPPEALPPNLSSAYPSSDPSAHQPVPPGVTPSSEAQFSSTAHQLPNEALRQAVLDDTLPEKNPQPNADVGEMGLKDAWKNRTV